MRSKQILFTGIHKTQLVEVDVRAIKANEVLTEMEYTGLTGLIKFTPDGDISRNYMICGGTAERTWEVLEGFDYALEA